MTELTRDIPFEMRTEDGGDGLTLDGYGAVFGERTRIDSWEGIFDEEIAPGAFKKTLRERKPIMQWNHGNDPAVGQTPIAAFESLREDDRGLHVIARMHDNQAVKPVRDAIASGAVDGMSFRFQIVKDEWRDATGRMLTPDETDRALARSDRSDPTTIPLRSVREVKLFEVGPVAYPAYATTSVGVRSRELAELLTDPQVRAEAALILASTPTESGEGEGPSDEGRAAPTADEPASATPGKPVPSPAARDRALRLEREIR